MLSTLRLAGSPPEAQSSSSPHLWALDHFSAQGSTEPNQDNFCVAHFSNGYKLAAVFDGHGRKGILLRFGRRIMWVCDCFAGLVDKPGQKLLEAI